MPSSFYFLFFYFCDTAVSQQPLDDGKLAAWRNVESLWRQFTAVHWLSRAFLPSLPLFLPPTCFPTFPVPFLLPVPCGREINSAVRQFDAIRRATLHSITARRREVNLERAWYEHLKDLVDKFFPGHLAW